MPSFVPRAARSTAFQAVGAVAILSMSSTVAASSAPEVFLARSASGSTDVFGDVERFLGSDLRKRAEGRVEQFEDAMRPVFASLPRTEDGRLPAAGARYLLHRTFVDRNSWFVRGLEDDGRSWNMTSPADGVFGLHIGALASRAFEERFARGLTLSEVAAFAATVEGLVSEEQIDRLRAVYRASGIPESDGPGAVTSDAQAQRVIDGFMITYVLAQEHENLTAAVMSQLWRQIDKYPHWAATRAWVRDVRRDVLHSAVGPPNAFSTTALVVEELMRRYGRWQNRECNAIKHDLVRLEFEGNGRVLLHDFYRSALKGQALFTEDKGYLRDLGALDETDAAKPSVLIANYINAPANCLAETKFFSVCCINECDSILGAVERGVAAPDALPGRILEIVEGLPSPSVSAPRVLPAVMIERLEAIAAQHGGRVPLHGRLFAQWLHHAYPRECPFPHVSGTTMPMRGPEWHARTGGQYLANRSTLWRHVEELAPGAVLASMAADSEPVVLPWTHDEELPLHPPAASAPRGARELARGLALLFAALSLTAALRRTADAAIAEAGAKAKKWEAHSA